MLDLTFKTPDALAGFSAAGGNVAYETKALSFSFDGAGVLQSPEINVPQGHIYSAHLNYKNTVLMRIKNESDAKEARLRIISSENGEYDDRRAVTLPLAGDGEFHPYYFNFSALGKMPGYLRGFRLEVSGKGRLVIGRVSFEEEVVLYPYAGRVATCKTDGVNVTVTGTVLPEYAGQEVRILETDLINAEESAEDLSAVAVTRAASDGAFTAVFPFRRGNMTHLSSYFLAVTEGVKVAPMFRIENYEDFAFNPYAFTLPDLTVDVTKLPFSAKGDHFTDDTDPIQQAIDHVAALGGGTVVVPGDDSFYGRRYVITNLTLKDNIELRIEKGAVLWQTQDPSEYRYEPAFGHDLDNGISWSHCGLVHNLPLIYAKSAKNIKVTGGGTIRSHDPGSENKNGTDLSLLVGCGHKVHCIPIGIYDCENVEVRDVSLKRTNVYHSVYYACKNVYIANVTMNESKCLSGDGISLGVGTHHVKIEHCFFQSNDDGVVLCCTYNEPRGINWWHAHPERDNSVHHVEICHSFFSSGRGKAISFIPWGTDAPDLSRIEIRDITAYDNTLQGCFAVGGWYDNPYFGKKPFDNSETDDFSPIKNVRIHDNRSYTPSSLQFALATNFISDCGIRSADRFLNGDFDYKKYEGQLAGLCYWSYTENGAADSVTTVMGKTGYMGRIAHFENGYVDLYQGLYLAPGTHRFTADAAATSAATLFIRNAINGENLAKAAVTGDEMKPYTVTVTLEAGGTYFLGIASAADRGEAYIDNAALSSEFLPVAAPPRDVAFSSADTPAEGIFDLGVWGPGANAGEISAPPINLYAGIRTLAEYSHGTFSFDVRMKEVLTFEGDNKRFYVRLFEQGDDSLTFEWNVASGSMYLSEFTAGNRKALSKAEMRCTEVLSWHRITVTFCEKTVSVSFDGEKILTAEGNFTPGFIGIYGNQAVPLLRNFEMTV